MYKKLLIASVLIAFVGVQLANTLQCYECATPTSCRSPSIVTCTERTANNTYKALQTYFSNVVYRNSTNFECLNLNATQNNVNTVEIRGCTFLPMETCNLQTLATYPNLVQRNCTRCAGNLCNNGRNPAGKVTSSLYTLMASIVMVMIAKITVM